MKYLCKSVKKFRFGMTFFFLKWPEKDSWQKKYFEICWKFPKSKQGRPLLKSFCSGRKKVCSKNDPKFVTISVYHLGTYISKIVIHFGPFLGLTWSFLGHFRDKKIQLEPQEVVFVVLCLVLYFYSNFWLWTPLLPVNYLFCETEIVCVLKWSSNIFSSVF